MRGDKLTEMSIYRRFIYAGRLADCAAIMVLSTWVTASILWAEISGFPYIYGWPWRVVRLVDGDQPDFLVWICDFVGACGLITATWFAAVRCCRARMTGFRFSLGTLLGVATSVAIVMAIWRWSADHLFEPKFGGDGEFGTTIAALDMTAFMAYVPASIPLSQVVRWIVRIGLAAGLGCTIFVVGRFAIVFVRCIWHKKPTPKN
jgi:hypothetical protein